MVEEEVVMNNTENKEDELTKKHEEQNDEQVSQMSDLTDQVNHGNKGKITENLTEEYESTGTAEHFRFGRGRARR